MSIIKAAKAKRLDTLFDKGNVGWIFESFNYTRFARKSARYRDFIAIGTRKNVLITFVNATLLSKIDH